MAPRPIDVTIRGSDQTKAAFDSAKRNADGFVSGLKSLAAGPTAVIGAVTALATGVVATFAKASVESAANADAAWGRVEQSVDNVGISFNGVRSQLDALFTSIQQTTRYSDDDAASAFSTLVTISGDYTGSLKNLTLAADIAAAKQMSIGDAATIVGKVMTGQTAMLQRYGIAVKSGGNAIDELQKKFSGFAARDAGTLEGRLDQVANAWDNIKEAVGRALTGDAQAGGMSAFAQSLNDIGTWIDGHRAEIHQFADGIVLVAQAFGRAAVAAAQFWSNSQKFDLTTWKGWFGSGGGLPHGLGIPGIGPVDTSSNDSGWASTADDQRPSKAVDPKTTAQLAANARQVAADKRAAADKAADTAEKTRLEDLKKEYDYIEKLSDRDGLRVQDAEKLAAIQSEMARAAANANLSAANRSTAIDFLTAQSAKEKAQLAQGDALQQEFDKNGNTLGNLRANGVHADQYTGPDSQGGFDNRLNVRATAAPLPPVSAGSSSFLRGAGTYFQDALGGPDAFKGVDTSLGSLEDHLQSFTGGALANFFSTWQDGIADVVTGHEALGKAALAAARKAIGGAMAAEGQQVLFKAAAAAVEGFTNPAAFLQAAKYLAIGTAELGAAAALSGGGYSSGGSYSSGGGGGGAVSAAGLQQSQSEGVGQKTTIYLRGNGLNFKNADDLAALRDAIRELGDTRELEFVVGGP